MHEIRPAKVLQGRILRGSVAARINIDGREYINFFGAGYLALGSLPEIRSAVSRALEEGVPFAQQLPPSHGAVDPIFHAVEKAGALACGTEASVYFGSGYLIGSVAVAAIYNSFDLVLIDPVS